MTPEKKSSLLKQGYVEDDTYPDMMWSPIRLGDQSGPRPLWMRERDLCLGAYGIAEREDYRGKAWHFMRMCDVFFGKPNDLFYMQWNPNAVRIVNGMFSCNLLSVLGCKDGSKSYTLACIAVGMYLLNPSSTKVLVTSTTMDSARGKIWGDIEYAWNQMTRVFKSFGIRPPGRLMGSPVIRYEMDGSSSYKSGIELIPTQSSSEKQSVEKVQGYKGHGQNIVIFIGDEWDTLPQGLVRTVNENIIGKPECKCIAAFNPTGRFTSGGKLAKPKAEWDSINIDSLEWEGMYGPVIRLDATRSENLDLGYEKWKGLMTREKLEGERIKYGSEDSAGWMTFVRGFFPAIGEIDCIYSDAEVNQYLADHPVESWLDSTKKVAGVDPSYVHGGDEAIFVVGKVGKARINGQDKIVYERLHTIILDHFITDKSVSKDEQVVKLISRFMKEHGVAVGDLGVDVTGAPSFSSLLNREIGVGWMQVHSSSRPTDNPISKSDSRKCVDVFDTLMSELWYVGRPLIREGQIKGIDADTISEMTARTYKGKGAKGDKVVVESKRDMKKRTSGKSPNRSDAMFICIHVARVRHGLSSKEKPKSSKLPQEETDLDRFYSANPHMLPRRSQTRRQRGEVLETGMVGW